MVGPELMDRVEINAPDDDGSGQGCNFFLKLRQVPFLPSLAFLSLPFFRPVPHSLLRNVADADVVVSGGDVEQRSADHVDSATSRTTELDDTDRSPS